MMRRVSLLMVFVFLWASSQEPAGAFTSVSSLTFTASAVVGNSSPLLLTITTPQTPIIPAQVFYTKNLVVPVTITSSSALDPKNVQVQLVYQLMSNTIPSPSYVPATFQLQAVPGNPYALSGTVVIARDQLASLQSGNNRAIQYFFRAIQGGRATLRTSGGMQAPVPEGSPSADAPADPFSAAVVSETQDPVSAAETRVDVQDTFYNDGKTSLYFPAGALSSPGTLDIRQLDPAALPYGPGGTVAAVAYDFSLEGATLLREFQLTLSYPSDSDGLVSGSRANPSSLAIYYLDPANGWALLGHPQTDTTLHTVTTASPHFSTYALFPTGATTDQDLRPAQRIITPNGDGINDAAIFGNGIDKIHIFDMHGRRVRTVDGPSSSAACAGSWCWDGTDDSGKIVESGVYLYQFTVNGTRVSGVIAVAK